MIGWQKVLEAISLAGVQYRGLNACGQNEYAISKVRVSSQAERVTRRGLQLKFIVRIPLSE